VVFLCLIVVITLTHPVPLLLVLAVCFIFFAVDLVGYRRVAKPSQMRRPYRDLLTLAAASSAILYVKLFATAHPLQQMLPEQGTFIARLAHRILIYSREDGLTLLYGPLWFSRAYRIALGVLLLTSIALALHAFVRNRAARVWTPGDSLLVLGLLLLVALPLVPRDLNGLFYFADRLPLLVWTALLLSASGSALFLRSPRSPSFQSTKSRFNPRTLAIAFAIAANTSLLIAAELVIRPVARAIAAVEATPVSVPGQLGFILEDPSLPEGPRDSPSWDPFYWAAIHVVRHNNGVLANAPWMDESILPVGPTSELPEQSIPALRTPVPSHVLGALTASPADSRAVFSVITFFVVEQQGRPHPSATDALLAIARRQQSRWSCRPGPDAWYSLCAIQASATR
jgi:hypothetical protein